MEGMALEEEQEEQWMPSGCLAVSRSAYSGSKPVLDWKQELRSEILGEVKEQMTAMSKSILDELRELKTQTASAPQANSRMPDNHMQKPRAPRNTAKYKWDPQGRPVCNMCDKVGHISRYCPTKTSNQDF